MNKYSIGIFGILLLTLCGDKFQIDNDMMVFIIIGFGLMVLVSGDKKKE